MISCICNNKITVCVTCNTLLYWSFVLKHRWKYAFNISNVFYCYSHKNQNVLVIKWQKSIRWNCRHDGICILHIPVSEASLLVTACIIVKSYATITKLKSKIRFIFCYFNQIAISLLVQLHIFCYEWFFWKWFQ